jgi:hypothetical protein
LQPWDRSNADEHGDVQHWLKHGCPHEDMEFLSEEVGAWAGMRYFQQALREAGGSAFPTLLAHLPKTNDGFIPAAAVPAVLAELDHFEHRARLSEGSRRQASSPSWPPGRPPDPSPMSKPSSSAAWGPSVRPCGWVAGWRWGHCSSVRTSASLPREARSRRSWAASASAPGTTTTSSTRSGWAGTGKLRAGSAGGDEAADDAGLARGPASSGG